MSTRRVQERAEDYDEFEDDWDDEDTIQPIRRKYRAEPSERRRDDKRNRGRRREPPAHKREEPS
jgi:hypothetical protein